MRCCIFTQQSFLMHRIFTLLTGVKPVADTGRHGRAGEYLDGHQILCLTYARVHTQTHSLSFSIYVYICLSVRCMYLNPHTYCINSIYSIYAQYTVYIQSSIYIQYILAPVCEGWWPLIHNFTQIMNYIIITNLILPLQEWLKTNLRMLNWIILILPIYEFILIIFMNLSG